MGCAQITEFGRPGSAVEGYENAHVSGALLGNSCDFGLIIISTGAGDAKVLWLGIAELPWLTTVILSQYFVNSA